jgi:hypothetical protein
MVRASFLIASTAVALSEPREEKYLNARIEVRGVLEQAHTAYFLERSH